MAGNLSDTVLNSSQLAPVFLFEYYFPLIFDSRVSEMFSSTQFDVTSAFSGGGFMPSQSTQLTDSAPSPAKSRDSQGLVPATVKQISQASHSGDEKSSFVIDGVDVTNVTVVGMVFDKAEKVTDVGFIVDDGTGRIGCRRWVNENFDTTEMQNIQDGMYVRINGHLRSFHGVRQLLAFSVRPVTNFDEVTFHFIDCIHTHLQNSKLQLKLQGGASIQPHMVESSVNTPVRSGSNGNQTSTSIQLSKQYSVDGLKDCDQLVLEYLQQSSSMGQEKGTHIDELCQQLRLPMEKIKGSIRSLEDEGLIYSTIDEFHYKAT
ncbi:replication protein A 32 kDa subunit A-like [Hevea brasiliensis]|uniref:replication protein A 32 kDa subunit A-like n=1 Tax=Hevea brasiliensis TaxID=3981 RepID=UPI0025EC339C|nr:replication protein A 32 kDa subunit A-like [Hevea brasiliensis]